jgi:hypothetical protein
LPLNNCVFVRYIEHVHAQSDVAIVRQLEYFLHIEIQREDIVISAVRSRLS